jgi:hypothetical protein
MLAITPAALHSPVIHQLMRNVSVVANTLQVSVLTRLLVRGE